MRSLPRFILLSSIALVSACANVEVETNSTALAPQAPASTPAVATPVAEPAPAPALKKLHITATVPEGTGTVYLPGSIPELGPWDPDLFAMQGTGRERTATLDVPAGTRVEFKFTLGSWDREGLGPSGTVMPNYVVNMDGDKNVAYEIADFKKDPVDYVKDPKGSGVLGRLEYMENVKSAHLEHTRHVEVWLPPGYDENPTHRYPVLYMHDGQNLFDPRIANTGVDWGVDESIVRLVKLGKIEPVIVVGSWCTDARLREYSPWDLGPNYAKFLIEELMPVINSKYRTLTGPENTTVMGSSMGGLISFYLVREHSDVFGKAGCVSTHWPWNGDLNRGKVLPPLIEKELVSGATMPKGVKVYFDYGTAGVDAEYEPLQFKVNAWLKAQGFEEGRDYVVRKFAGADHNETNWRKRLDEPMTFLFGTKE